MSSYSRYVGHVITVIGGVTRDAKATDQAGPVYAPVPAGRQREAMAFLRDQVLTTPTWLVPEAVLRRIEGVGALDRVRQLQASVLARVLDPARMQRMTETATFAGADSYLPAALLADVRGAVWGELSRGAAIDPWRRALQRAHVERLITLAVPGDAPVRGVDAATAEARPLARRELVILDGMIRVRGDAATQAHLADIKARIAAALDEER